MTVRVLIGDCLEQLAALPAESVHCCITSPPYYGLRCYGVDGQIGLEPTPEEHIAKLVEVFREVRRVLRKDGTLWLNYGDAYAASPSGHKTGDDGRIRPGVHDPNTVYDDRTFTNKPFSTVGNGYKAKDLLMMPARVALALQQDGWWLRSMMPWVKRSAMPESVTDRPATAIEYVFLLAKSQRYYFDMEAVRQGVTGNAHARRSDGERPYAQDGGAGFDNRQGTWKESYVPNNRNFRNSDLFYASLEPPHGLICGDEPLALDVNPAAFSESHFATFPPKLVEPLIKAATSEKGVCAECGAPWVREVVNDLSNVPTRLEEKRAPVQLEEMAEYLKERREASGLSRKQVDQRLGTNTLYSWFEGRPAGIETPTPVQWTKLKAILSLDSRFDDQIYGTVKVEVTDHAPAKAFNTRTYEKTWNSERKTTGWSPSCACTEPAVVPATILDCFGGAGTVGLVADRLGRDSILIELNPEYADMARRRISGDSPLFAEVS